MVYDLKSVAQPKSKIAIFYFRISAGVFYDIRKTNMITNPDKYTIFETILRTSSIDTYPEK
jgi:hypothetical protein